MIPVASTIDPNLRAEPPSPSHQPKLPLWLTAGPPHRQTPNLPWAALGASSAAWDWVHLPSLGEGRKNRSMYVEYRPMATLLPAMAVLGFFLFGWTLMLLLLLQSVHEKSCRSFTSLNYLLPKHAQWGLLLIHPRATLCGWTSQQRPLQATSLPLDMDRHSQRGQITSPEKLPRCGWDLPASCARTAL